MKISPPHLEYFASSGVKTYPSLLGLNATPAWMTERVHIYNIGDFLQFKVKIFSNVFRLQIGHTATIDVTLTSTLCSTDGGASGGCWQKILGNQELLDVACFLTYE